MKDYPRLNSMNKTYRKLQKTIYGMKCPDGIPLEKGCEVEVVDIDSTNVRELSETATFEDITYDEDEMQIYEWNEYSILVTEKDDTQFILESVGDSTSYLFFENIGKPLTLADVLWALDSSSKKYRCYNIHNGLMEIWVNNGIVEPYLSLTLPVSEWSEETLKAIIDLIE